MDDDKTLANKRKLAPVLVSVYDRKEHLQRCIEALLENPEASQTTLYIVSDGWQHESHRQAIEGVREYIGTITGFKEVKTRFRDTNWGMGNSSRDAADWVFSTHDRLIRMEDDNICSPLFLKYMNEALTAYEADKRIYAICAHTHPHFLPPRRYKHDTFLWNSFSPWGFGYWKDRYLALLMQYDQLYKRLEDPDLWRRYNKIRPHGDTRKGSLRGEMKGDALIRLYIFINNLYCVFPTHSLTINSGMDGSGTNCALGWTYPSQQLHSNTVQIETNLTPSKQINQKLYRVHYSFINHCLVPILRQMGCFDPLYKIFQKLTCKQYK